MQKHKIVVEGNEITLVEMTVIDRFISWMKEDVIPWLSELKDIFTGTFIFTKALLKEKKRAEKIMGHKTSFDAFYKMWNKKWKVKMDKIWNAKELNKNEITGKWEYTTDYNKYFEFFDGDIKKNAEKIVSVDW